MNDLVFCKWGGSVITDKGRPQTARPAVIARLAEEAARSLAARPLLRLVMGHGSGSFGHSVAHQYGTRHGACSSADWHGFAEVAAAAARLNRLVTDALLRAGVPAWSIAPSASAGCREGMLVSMDTGPVEKALAHGLVPVVYGDVALDEAWGATIVSTEQVFRFLARRLGPERIILVSDVDGAFSDDPRSNPNARPVPLISAANWAEVRAALAGSHATDVTGGMQAKVEDMVGLVQEMPGLVVHIVSGERPGALEELLVGAERAGGGTVIRWERQTGT